jgi:hypothetical protein
MKRSRPFTLYKSIRKPDARRAYGFIFADLGPYVFMVAGEIGNMISRAVFKFYKGAWGLKHMSEKGSKDSAGKE